MGGVQDGDVTHWKALSFILYKMQTYRYNKLSTEGLIAQLNAHARNAATGLHALNFFIYQHTMFKTLVPLILYWKQILGFRLHSIIFKCSYLCIK